MPGMGELIVILLIVLVVFGANKLPGIGDALGRSIKNFKKASSVDEETTRQEAGRGRRGSEADRGRRRRRRMGRGRRPPQEEEGSAEAARGRVCSSASTSLA